MDSRRGLPPAGGETRSIVGRPVRGLRRDTARILRQNGIDVDRRRRWMTGVGIPAARLLPCRINGIEFSNWVSFLERETVAVRLAC